MPAEILDSFYENLPPNTSTNPDKSHDKCKRKNSI